MYADSFTGDFDSCPVERASRETRKSKQCDEQKCKWGEPGENVGDTCGPSCLQNAAIPSPQMTMSKEPSILSPGNPDRWLEAAEFLLNF